MPDPIYVIGHVNPDTDTIAAALGYAWLLHERDGLDTIAARASAINPQTAWVLKLLELESPLLLTDASPRFESVTHRYDSTTTDQPLRDAWAIASRTGGVAPILNPDRTPYGLITGASLFEYFSKVVGPHLRREDMTISEMLNTPCVEAADTHVPKFQASSRIRDSLNRVLRETGDEFWTVDDKGVYAGICRQRDILNPPRLKLILVDHNEPQQALGSLEEAELYEILDHHRLGNPSTHVPIRFTVDVVGSTSTLISERTEEAGLMIPAPLAGMLLAGLLSDTLILTSPTTTPRDHQAAERLGRWAFTPGSPITGETVKTFGEKLLASGTGLGTRKPNEVVMGDMKVYTGGGLQFSISQVEVSDLVEVNPYLGDLLNALEAFRVSRGLDFAILMVTDIVRGVSRFIIANCVPALGELPYVALPDGTWLAEDVVSRKKQVLPVVLGLLEA